MELKHMNRIINPNAPRKSTLDEIIDTMRVIAAYRLQYHDLRAMLQNDGVQEPLTATQIERIHQAMQAVAENLIEFIMYGANKNGSNTSNSERIIAPPQDTTKDNAPQAQRPEQAQRTPDPGQDDKG